MMDGLGKVEDRPRFRADLRIARFRDFERLERHLFGNRSRGGFVRWVMLSSLTLMGFLLTYVPPGNGVVVDPIWSNYGGILVALMTGGVILLDRFRISADGGVFCLLIGLLVLAAGANLGDPQRVRYLIVPFAFLVLSSLFFAGYLGGRGERQFEVCVGFWVIFAVVSLLVAAIAQLAGGVRFMGVHIEPQALRWAGWYGNANRFGPAVAVGALAAFAMASWRKSRPSTILLGLVGVVLIGGVISSGSRATLLALAIGLSVLLWVQVQRVSTRIVMLVFATSVVLLAFLLIPDDVLEVYKRGNSNELRMSFIKKGVEMFSSGSPWELLFGHGYGAFQRVVGYSTHNGYLRLILEFGLAFTMGMSILLAFLLARARAGLTQARKANAFLLALLAFLLVREVGSPALIGVRVESLAFAFVIGALAASPWRKWAALAINGGTFGEMQISAHRHLPIVNRGGHTSRPSIELRIVGRGSGR